MTRKRLLSLLLACALAFGCLTATAFAGAGPESGVAPSPDDCPPPADVQLRCVFPYSQEITYSNITFRVCYRAADQSSNESRLYITTIDDIEIVSRGPYPYVGKPELVSVDYYNSHQTALITISYSARGPYDATASTRTGTLYITVL